MDKFFNEIENRGFETGFDTGYKNESWAKSKHVEIECIEKRRGLRLYKLDSWKKYSRNCVYPCTLVYLAGVERGEYWAVRCPSTVDSINEALDYTTPAEVKKAKKSGKKVLRQGDVFIVEKTRDCKSLLPENHTWNSETRMLTHPTHRDIKVDFPCKFLQGKSVNSQAD